MRKTWLSFCAVALLLVPASRPVAAQATDAKPVLVVTVASLEQLFKNIDTIGEIAQSGALTDIVKLQLQTFTQGIDKKRPCGVVVTAQDGAFDGFGFIPVTDFKQLVNTLGGDEASKGVYEITKFDRPVFAKEHKGWALLAAKPDGFGNIPEDPSKLLSGQEKEYDVAVKAYARNVPEFWRTLAVQQLSAGVELADRLEGETEEEFEARKKMAKATVQQLTKMIEESDTLTIGWSVDDKAKKTFFEAKYTAIPDSETAKSLGYLNEARTNFAGFLIDGAAVTFNVAGKARPADTEPQRAILSTLKDQLPKKIDESNELEGEAEKAAAKKIVAEGFAVLDKMLAEGMFDGAGSVQLAPDALTVLVGAHVANGAELESVFKQAMDLLAKKEKDAPKFTYNADSHKGARIHTATLPVPDPNAAKLLGDSTQLAVAFSDKAAYLALGKDSIAKLKSAMDQSAAEPNKSVTPVEFAIALGPILKVAAANDGNPVLQTLGDEVAKYKGKDRLVITAKPVANGVAYRYELEQGIIALSGKAIALFGFGGGRGF